MGGSQNYVAYTYVQRLIFSAPPLVLQQVQLVLCVGKDLIPQLQRIFLYVPHNTDTKWSLKTWIDFSEIFSLWSCGGTSWYFVPFFVITSLNSSEHSLSRRCNFGYIPFSFNLLINFWYVLIIFPPVIFLIGSLKMLLLSSLNSTTMYLFPQNDITGNLPVWTEYIL